MKFRIITLSLGSLLSMALFTPTYSQSLPAQPVPVVEVEKVITTVALNWLGPSVGQERRLGSSTSYRYGLGVHYSYYATGFPLVGTRFLNIINQNFGRDYSTSGITPYAFGEARFYNTLFRRARAGKDVRHNAASYFALFGELPLVKDNLIDVPNLAIASVVGLKYGMRRSLGRHLYLEGSAGIANKISRSQSTVLPRLDAALAWAL